MEGRRINNSDEKQLHFQLGLSHLEGRRIGHLMKVMVNLKYRKVELVYVSLIIKCEMYSPHLYGVIYIGKNGKENIRQDAYRWYKSAPGKKQRHLFVCH